jgi:prepilin-type N-terminal cleavage/methylation domain-containing protein
MLWGRIRSRVERAASLSARCSRCARAQGEQGFTLIELLIVLVILPIIVGGVSIAVITSLKDSTGVQNRIGDSADAQITSAYYVRDVQSATNLTTDPSASDPALCAAPSSATSSELLLALFWAGSASGDTVTSYWLVSNSQSSGTTTYQLTRSFCPNASATSTTPISPSETSALALDPSGTPQTATVTCATTAPTSCAGYPSGWVSTAGISSVALAALESGSAYQYNLSAAPRSWNSASGGLPPGGVPFPPITLLGSSGTVLSLSGSSNSINVTGGIGFNSDASDAMNIAGSSLKVVDIGGSFSVFGCGSPCNVINLSGSSLSYSLPSAIPTSSSYPTPTLTAPDVSALPTVNCMESGNTYTCPPGQYGSSAFSFLSSASSITVNFTGSASSDVACPYCYEFDGTLSIAGSSNTVEFGSGDYIFENGLTISGSSNSITGTGVFLYVAVGAVNINIPGSSNDVNLSPPTSGPYAGVLLFQASSTSDTIGGSSAEANSYNGAIEAPYAQVTIVGSSNGVTIGAIVAKTLIMSGSSGSLTVSGL